MKKTASYEIDHISATIYVTKAFVKEASILNTPEYKTMLNVRRDNPDYKIEVREIAKKSNKKTYRNLTVENIETFIRNSMEDKRSVEVRMVELEAVKKLSKSHPSPYAYLKKWFLDEYGKEYNKRPGTNEQESAAASSTGNVVSLQQA